MNKKKKIIILGAMLIIAIAVVATMFLININSGNATYTSVITDSSFKYASARYKNGVVVCGGDKASFFGKNGKTEWTYSFSFTDPILSVQGNYVLIADRDGGKAVLLSNGKETSVTETDYGITTACVNDSGYYAVTTKEKGYKATITVYSPKGEEIYVWHSAKYNPLDAAVSSSGKMMAVAVLDTANLETPSGMLTFKFSDDEGVFYPAKGNSVIMAVRYDGNSAVAIGDEESFSITKWGKEKYRIDYKGRTLQFFDFDKGYLTLAFPEKNGTVIENYGKSGKPGAKYLSEKTALYLDSENGYTLLGNIDKTVVINRRGNIKSEFAEEHNCSYGVLVNSGKAFFIKGNRGYIAGAK